ncbi:importin beta-2 family protein [Salix suchowensis]|nr:importin beta-2 family protein [Salix suchowensis]
MFVKDTCFSVPDAWSTASQVIAKIAGIELPQRQWPELIGSLLSNIHQLPAHVKQATLETLGYLCEEVSPDVVDQDHVNKILTAVVQGMNASEGNNDVRLAATRALYNALGFAQANFSNDMERDYIMRVDIFNITAKAVREDEEPVALQAIEFWSSICDEEIDILEEYGGDFTGDSDIPCFYFIKQALPALVPMLLETLLKQEEDQDQDEELGILQWLVEHALVWLQGLWEMILCNLSCNSLKITLQNQIGGIERQLLMHLARSWKSMKDVANVAEKACGALYFLAQGYEDVTPSSPLTPYFQEIVQALLTVTHREDAGESRLRTAAYETLNEVVRCSTDETSPMVLQLVPVIMTELHNTS